MISTKNYRETQFKKYLNRNNLPKRSEAEMSQCLFSLISVNFLKRFFFLIFLITKKINKKNLESGTLTIQGLIIAPLAIIAPLTLVLWM